jgi:hypothetical protein
VNDERAVEFLDPRRSDGEKQDNLERLEVPNNFIRQLSQQAKNKADQLT